MAGRESDWMLLWVILACFATVQTMAQMTPYGNGAGTMDPYQPGGSKTMDPYQNGEEFMNPLQHDKQLEACEYFYKSTATEVIANYPELQDMSIDEVVQTPEFKAFVDNPFMGDQAAKCEAVSKGTMDQMTPSDSLGWFMQVSTNGNNLKYMLDPKKGLSDDMLLSLMQKLVEMKATLQPQIAGALHMIMTEYVKRKGGLKKITAADLTFLGPAVVTMMPSYTIDHLPQDVLDLMFDHIADETKKMFSGNNAEFVQSATTYYMLEHDKNRLKAFCRNAFNKKLNAENFPKFAIWLPCAKSKVCGKLDVSLVQNNLDLISMLPWTCHWNANKKMKEAYFPNNEACGKKLAKIATYSKGPNPVLFKYPDDMKNLKMLAPCVEYKYWVKVLGFVDCTMIKELLTDEFLPDKVDEYAVKKCVAVPKDLKTMNCDNMMDFALVLPKLKHSQWKKIPMSVVCDMKCLNIFNQIPKFPSKVKFTLMTKCYGKLDDAPGSSPATITKEQVQQLGSMITELPMNQMKAVSADDISANVEEIKNKLKANKGKGKTKVGVVLEIAKKMAKANKLAEVTDSKEIMKQMSLKDLKQAAQSGDIEADLGLDATSKEMALTSSQQKWVMGEILKKKKADNFSVDEIKSKGALVKGFLSSDIGLMSADKTKNQMEMAIALCEQSGWALKPLQKINQGLMLNGLLSINSTHPMSALTALDVTELGCECLMYYKSMELEAMKTDVCSSVCGKVGYCDHFRCVNPTQRSNVLQACLKCKGLGEALMTEVEIDTLGPNMIAQLSATQLNTLVPGSVLRSKISDLKGMCMVQELRDAVALSLVHEFGGSGAGFDADSLIELGSGIMLLPAKIQAQLDKTIIAEIAASIMSELKPKTDTEKDLKKCCQMWLSDADKADLKEHKEALKITVKDAIISTMAALRRKRATLLWKCAQIQILEEAFTTVPDGEITAMDGNEFLDCLPDMGQFTTWSDTQKSILLSKAETELGTTVCKFASTDITSLGEISTALTTDNIACMPLDIQDVVSLFGSISGWTTAQLTAFASAYKTANNKADLTNILSADIIVLGNLLCGFSTVDLAGVPISAIAEIGTQIGSLSECPVAQLSQLKTLATDTGAYGPVAGWTAAEVQELKYIIAGLDGTEIKALNIQSLEGMIPDVVSKIPAEVFKMMSTSQLEGLTETQAVSVSADQKAAMTSDQVNLLAVIMSGGQQLVEEVTVAPELISTTPSASPGVEGTVFLMITAVCVSWKLW